ncbi:MAG: hypothetical protein V4719_28300 [Planctomycetota bacterium]|jgi:hypothetical protein
MSLKLYAPENFDLAEAVFPNLSVYHEPEAELELEPEEDSHVLSWRFIRRSGSSSQSSFIEAVQRSRLLHMHRRCQECGRPTVHPMERNDAVLGKNRLPIPGTSTVVGFHCDYCQSEWSA